MLRGIEGLRNKHEHLWRNLTTGSNPVNWKQDKKSAVKSEPATSSESHREVVILKKNVFFATHGQWICGLSIFKLGDDQLHLGRCAAMPSANKGQDTASSVDESKTLSCQITAQESHVCSICQLTFFVVVSLGGQLKLDRKSLEYVPACLGCTSRCHMNVNVGYWKILVCWRFRISQYCIVFICCVRVSLVIS